MVKVNIESSVKVGDTVVHASPTDACIDGILNHISGVTYPAHLKLDALWIYTTEGSRLEVGLPAEGWSYTVIANGYRATTKRRVYISDNVTVKSFALVVIVPAAFVPEIYTLFAYDLPTPLDVPGGSALDVTITIDVTVSLSHTAGGTLFSMMGEMSFARFLLERLTAEKYFTKRIDTLDLYKSDQYLFSVPMSVSRSGNVVTYYAEHTPELDTEIDEYRYRSVDVDFDLIIVKLASPVMLTAGLRHTWTLTVQM